jgi:hypothetical protein
VATSLTLSQPLQDLLEATTSLSKSAASDIDVMDEGNASAVSPANPASASNTSVVQSAGFIAAAVIGAVLALAVLVALLIFIWRKRNSSGSAQALGKIIVRFSSGSCLKMPDQRLFALSSAGVYIVLQC